VISDKRRNNYQHGSDQSERERGQSVLWRLVSAVISYDAITGLVGNEYNPPLNFLAPAAVERWSLVNPVVQASQPSHESCHASSGTVSGPTPFTPIAVR
jgi:hypothetical protein